MTDLVIVTGGSRGLGAALVDSVPFDAHRVDVSRSGGGPAEQHVRADLTDVGDWAVVTAAITDLVDVHDPARAVLVHAAGTLTPIGFAGEVGLLDYARSVMLNSAAGQVLGHHFLAATAGRSERRDLVMISSGAATTAYEGWSAYNAGKAALDHWVRTVGAEQRRRGGARVCAVAPGVVATEMQAQIRATEPADFPAVERFVELHDRGRLRDPGEVAAQLWRVVEDGLEPGSVVDLREL